MDDLRNARAVLEGAARDFDPSGCSGQDAIDVMTSLGVQRKLIDGMIAKAGKRVEDTAAYTYGSDRNAAEVCARLVGVGTGEARRAIETASQMESLPVTDAAVRAGVLSSRQAELIAGAAVDDPSVERELLKVAAQGCRSCGSTAWQCARLGRTRRRVRSANAGCASIGRGPMPTGCVRVTTP